MIEYFKTLIGKETTENSPSPFGRWLNGKILAAEIGKLIIEFKVREEFANPAGIIHGGVLAGIIDEVIGMTTFSLGKEGFYVAVNLNIDFLRPGTIGQTVRAETEVIRDGRTMAHVECKIYNEDGKIVAKAASNLALTKR